MYYVLFSIEPHLSISRTNLNYQCICSPQAQSQFLDLSVRHSFNYSVDAALVYVRALITSHDGLVDGLTLFCSLNLQVLTKIIQSHVFYGKLSQKFVQETTFAN